MALQKKCSQEPQDTSDNSKELFSKWDRIIAATACVIALFAVLILVIIVIEFGFYDKQSAKENSLSRSAPDLISFKNSADAKLQKLQASPKCSQSSQGVACANVAAEDLCYEINSWAELNQKTFVQFVQLDDIIYQNSQIQEGWLDCVALEFTQLVINGNLLDIGRGAFSGSPFKSLFYLVLNTGILNYRRDMFEGASLRQVEINCDVYATFDDNVFAEISDNLQILQLRHCVQQLEGENVISKISGASVLLPALKHFDLKNNVLTKLQSSSFGSAPSLSTLYLSNSLITEIEADTFKTQELLLLDISNNNLETLPEGIFDNARGISISGNQWQCDCDLVWLRDLYNYSPDKFSASSDFSCLTDSGYVKYSEVDFCPTTTTTTTPTTTSVTTSTTTRTTTPITTTTTTPTTTTPTTTTPTTTTPTTTTPSTTTPSTTTPTTTTPTTTTPTTTTPTTTTPTTTTPTTTTPTSTSTTTPSTTASSTTTPTTPTSVTTSTTTPTTTSITSSTTTPTTTNSVTTSTTTPTTTSVTSSTTTPTTSTSVTTSTTTPTRTSITSSTTTPITTNSDTTSTTTPTTTSVTSSTTTTASTTTHSTTTPTTTPTTTVSTTTIPTTSIPTTTTPTTLSTQTTGSNTTTPGITTTTTPLPPPFLTNCTESLKEIEITLSESDTIEKLQVRRGSVTIEFFSKETTNPDYVVQITGNISNSNLLWFNSLDQNEYYCRRNINDGSQVEILNLCRNETYIFCLMDSNETSFSPFDCTAFTVIYEDDRDPGDDGKSDEAWIYTKDKAAVIGGICGSLIFAVIMSGLIVFLLMRRYPDVIKGRDEDVFY